MEKNKKIIGCKYCRQSDDMPETLQSENVNAGWLGTLEESFELDNTPYAYDSDDNMEMNDEAFIGFSLWQIKPHNDEPFVQMDLPIKFCPFCGANLQKVREQLIQEECEETD